MTTQRSDYWLERPGNVARLYRSLWLVGCVLALLDLVVHRHAEAGLDAWFGFYAAYGFIACVLLVLSAKLLRRLVLRPEDYYDR